MVFTSLDLAASVDGIIEARRVSERTVASLCCSGAWESKWMYWLVWVGFL